MFFISALVLSQIIAIIAYAVMGTEKIKAMM